MTVVIPAGGGGRAVGGGGGTGMVPGRRPIEVLLVLNIQSLNVGITKSAFGLLEPPVGMVGTPKNPRVAGGPLVAVVGWGLFFSELLVTYRILGADDGVAGCWALGLCAEGAFLLCMFPVVGW